jgi:threonine aldolase
MADVDSTGPAAAKWAARLKEVGVLVNAMGSYRLRFVTHHDVDRTDIEAALTAIAHLEL